MSNETDPSLKPPPPSEDANGAIAASGAPTHAFPGPGVVAGVPTWPVPAQPMLLNHFEQHTIVNQPIIDMSRHNVHTINYHGIGEDELKDFTDEIKHVHKDEFRTLREFIDAKLEAKQIADTHTAATLVAELESKLGAKLAKLVSKLEAKLAKFEAKLDAFKDEIFRALRMNYPAPASEANGGVQEAAVEESRGETPEADEWLRRFLGSKFNESEMMVLTRAARDGILPFKNKRNGQPCSFCASIIKETFEPGDSMSHAFRCSKHKGKDTH